MLKKVLQPQHLFFRVSKKPQTVKMNISILSMRHCEAAVKRLWQSVLLNTLKACFARHFDLLRNPDSNVPPVRRRVRVACLCGSFDLCQSAKKQVYCEIKFQCLRAQKRLPQKTTTQILSNCLFKCHRISQEHQFLYH